MNRHVLTTVAVAVLSLSMLGPPVQAQDTPSAQELADLRASAEAGDLAAQYNLGIMYAEGRDVPQDDAEAGCFRHQLLLPRPYLVLTKPLRLDIQCQRGASVKIG